AYAVRRRTKEIGIRIAMGATSRDVLRLVLAQSAVPLTIGWGAGVVASAAMMPLLRTQLVHVSPNDPLSLIAASGLLMVCGLIGCLLPARRANRIRVVELLRHD